MQHIPCRRRGLEAATVFLPHFLVQAIVEVEMPHVLELGPRRREQFLGRLDVPVHRAANVEEQQHLHRIVPQRPHLDIEIALMRGALDGAVEIEFIGAPVRANLRRRRSATLMLRVPSSIYRG
jgi:hypothetical protein